MCMATLMRLSTGPHMTSETVGTIESGMTEAVIIGDQPALLRLAFVLTGSRTYAEDIVQDVSEHASPRSAPPSNTRMRICAPWL